MPVTPFHLGPAALVKSIKPSAFSFKVFLLTQLIIDSEPLYYIIIGHPWHHRFLHTFLGATLVCVITLTRGREVCAWGIRVWNVVGKIGLRSFVIPNEPIPFKAAAAGAVFGSYSQIILDGMMHADMIPYFPFGYNNHLLHVLSDVHLHLLCLLTGIIGLIFLQKYLRNYFRAK